MVYRGRNTYRGRGGGGGFRGPPAPLMGGGGSNFAPIGPGPGAMGPQGAMPGAASRPVFDLTLCEPMFPKTKEIDDTALTNALVKRNTELTPSAAEQTAIQALVTKVTNSIEKFIVAPDLFQAASIEEVRQVGSFKKATMVAKHNIADLVVVLKTLPTVEAVTALGKKIVEDVKVTEPGTVLGCVAKDFGCEIAGTQAVVKLLITTLPQNMKKLDADLHLGAEVMRANVAAIFHARWFEENASQSGVRVLIRLLKDTRKRFTGLQPLNLWALELLAHYAVMNTPNRQPLPINQAFRRVFQLLAAGLFLPGAAGLADPCERGQKVQQNMSFEDMDLLCSTSQTLLRVLCHGGYKQILGMEGASNVATEMSVWDGVVVTPLERAYDEKEMFPKDEDEDEPMAEATPAAAAVTPAKK